MSSWSTLRRAAVTVIGILVLLVGAVLLVIPGPGIIVILLGIAILSIEYPWAKRVIEWLRAKLRRRQDKRM
jgi:uncharacterized protein (TIGR02611 family)